MYKYASVLRVSSVPYSIGIGMHVYILTLPGNVVIVSMVLP